MVSHQRSFESPESASPIVTRSVAAGLLNEYCDIYQFPGWQRFALKLISYFPQGVARSTISRFEGFSGLEYSIVQTLQIGQLVQERLNDYRDVKGPFPAITIGSALGGASAHLALALGGPFLPQAFVLTLRGGSFDGDAAAYFEQSADLAQEFVRNNPGVLTIQHFDPVHDEWMTRYVNHIRFKLLSLPSEYAAYIKANLMPGGTICYLDCRAKWLRYRVAKNSVFQVGGWGDIAPQEFLDGSERLEIYRRKQRLKARSWKLSGYSIEEGPESEWGSEPGLDEEIRVFCLQNGYTFLKISLPEPHNFSTLAFRAVQNLINKSDQTPSGVLIEMFSQFDASAVIKGGLLPLWLVFNTLDSQKYLEQMLSEFPADKPVFFSPLATFTQTPDLAAWSTWGETLNGFDWRNIGTRPSHYPANSATLIDWTKPLHAWIAENSNPITAKLNWR